MKILLKRWIHSISVSFCCLCLVAYRSYGQEASAQRLNHQGRIVVNGTNFQGNGQFKFALINGAGDIVWSNTAMANQEPVAAVGLTVTKGLYSLLLGDSTIPNMALIPSSVIDGNRDLSLRVWFNDGVHGFQKITPDQRFAAAPYAVIAERADLAVNFLGPLQGDVTGSQGLTSIAPTTVTAKRLTGFASGAGAITDSDTILTAINKLDGNNALKAPVSSPSFTGTVQLSAGTAEIAPLKLASGTNLTIPVFGAIEFDGNNLYLTNNSASPTRKTIAFADGSIANATNFSGSLAGDVTGTQNATTIAATTVTGKVLTGYSSTTGTITASDTILSAIRKLNGNVALKANLASPTFTGTVSGITASMVGLGNVTNTSDANKPVSTAQQAALDLKANLASPTFTGMVSGITASMVGLGNVSNTSDADKPVSTVQQAALDLKANLASPTFTGTVSGITAGMVGLGNVNNTSDANKPISTAQQTALDLKANLASPSFTGTVQLSTGTTEIAPLKLASGTNLTIPVFGAIEFDGNNLYLTNNSASPTRKTIAFADGSIANATNFSGSLAGDVTGTQNATTIAATTVTGKVLTGYSSTTGTITASDTILSAIRKLNGNVALKANLASPTFTGTVSGITASMVGLGNVTNTSDANKPVSTAQQAALDLKANLASPTFTGMVSGITASMVGLGNVNNTSDADKPISIAVQTALDGKQPVGSYATLVGGIVPAAQLPSYVDDVLEYATASNFPIAGEGDKIYVDTSTSKIYRWGGTIYVEISPSPGSTDSVVEGSIHLYHTAARAAAAAPVQSVSGRIGNIVLSKTDVGLGNVDNTADVNKPVSIAQQAALNLKAAVASPIFTGTVQLSSGTAEAAPLQLSSGTNLTTPAFGAIEFDGINLYLTNNSVSPTRKTIAFTDGSIANATNFSGSLSGDVTGTQNATVIAASTVTGKVLTGYSSTTGTITASDTILSAIRKLNGNIGLKANLASPTFTGTVSGITASMVGLGNVSNTSDIDKPVSTAQQAALDLKANLASPTFTGTVSGITASMVGLGNVSNTSDANKPVSTAQQVALDLKANLASPTFTGTVSGITAGMVGLANVNNTSDANKPVSTAQQAALDLKANLASPTFTGTVSGITKAMVGLGNVTNTNDTNKPVSIPQQAALDLKANLASPSFTGTVQLSSGTADAAPFRMSSGTNLTTPVFGAIEFDGTNLYLTNNLASPTRKTIAFTDGSITNATNFSGSLAGDVTGIQSATAIAATTVTGKVLTGYASAAGTITASDTILSAINKLNGNVALKANLASPTFTGTVSGITATMVGLGNVNNTSDANKPVSTAQQAALNLKANLASPTFTGTVSGITASMVGLGNVNNTSDANKPLSTAQQAALDLKANLTSPSFAGTVHLSTGTTEIAPLKLSSGTNLTTPTFGAIEFDGTHLYLTNNSTSPTRKTLAFTDSAIAVNLSQLTAAPAYPVLAWGSNSDGQTTVPTLTNVNAVAAGENHTLALMSDGSVRSWGSMTTVPATATSIAAIAAGNLHNLAVKNDGTVIAWGGNDYGQTTVPSGIANASRVAAGEKHSLVLRSTGAVAAWGDNSFGQTTVPLAASTGVIAIAAGYDHCLALKSDGSLIAWGRNDAGQTDVPVGLSNVIAIAAGAYHSIAVKSDGSVVAWGWDSGGQCSVPVGLTGVTKVVGGYAFSAALKSDGTVVSWGDNTNGQTTLPASASHVTQISAGGYHMVALRSNSVPAQIARLDQDNVLTGKLGVKRTAVNNTLEVEGNASKSTASNWLANSDRRIKTNISTISDGLEKINQVRLVDFRYTEEYLQSHPSIENRSYLNVIAQEFEKVFPEHVKESGEFLPDGSPILQVDTYPLTIYSAAAIQELHQENTELKKRLSDQEARIRKLEALMESR